MCLVYRSENPDTEYYIIRNDPWERWELLNGATEEALNMPLAYASFFNMSESTTDIPTNWTATNVNGTEDVFVINVTCHGKQSITEHLIYQIST